MQVFINSLDKWFSMAKSPSLYLLAIIGIVYLIQLTVPGFTEQFIFDPLKAFSEPWRFVTSMFLHSPESFLHILFNAYALFMFGTILENKVSVKNYLIIFFGAGIVGGFLYYLTYVFGIIPAVPALGASGAIYGVLGAVAMILPELPIFVWFIPMRMKHAAILWVIIEFIGTFNIASGVASAAHLGGLIFGALFAWYLKNQGIGGQAGFSEIRYNTYQPPPEWH